MLGPYVAGLIADQWSWRFVFWGILPVLVVSALLSLPAFRKLKVQKTGGDSGSGSPSLVDRHEYHCQHSDLTTRMNKKVGVRTIVH